MKPKAGRAAAGNPANRFEVLRLEVDDHCDQEDPGPSKIRTEFYVDEGRTIISENHSPDINFRYSINPYRGCEHGCAYCYARPGHETLGWGAGVDFESRIMVKQSAAELLRKELNRPRWRGVPITLSGVTDCYQPAERQLKITRSVLEVLVEARHAFSIITKNALVTRDLDLLRQAAQRRGVHVFISVTTLEQSLARELEPRTSSPQARLNAIGQLAAAGIPTGVMVAPLIPGLNDEEVPSILQAAAAAGAATAGTILLRLPHSVAPVFEQWLQAHLPPEKQQRILNRIRDCRGGQLNDSSFGSRMRGQGPYAETLSATFKTFARKYGLEGRLPPLDSSQFRPPQNANGQKNLF